MRSLLFVSHLSRRHCIAGPIRACFQSTAPKDTGKVDRGSNAPSNAQEDQEVSQEISTALSRLYSHISLHKGPDSDSSRKVETLALPMVIASLVGVAAYIRFSSRYNGEGIECST
jgi:hypothetical protein